MNSRMERYSELNDTTCTMTRSERNKGLYESIDLTDISRVKTNDNIKIIESSGKEINLDKIKKYILSMNEKKKVPPTELFKLDDELAEVKTGSIEIKDYDINSVLEKAQKGREIDYEEERHRKLDSTQYDILNKLKMYETQEEKDDEDFNTEERSLIDLINTVTIHKDGLDLLDDLTKGSENTEVVPPINIKEIEKAKKLEKELEKTKEIVNLKTKENPTIDKSFYTNSMTFGKKDFEGLEEVGKNEKKKNIILRIGIVLLIIAILVTLILIFVYMFNLKA